MDSKRLSHFKLVDLLSHENWKRLANDLGLPADTSREVVRKKPRLISKRISLTRLLKEVLSERGSAISMLADIMDFLDSHGVAARTTGEVASLPGLEELKPQQRKIISEWNEQARRRWQRDKEVEQLWEEASDALGTLLNNCSDEIRVRRRALPGLLAYSESKTERNYHEDVLHLLCGQIRLIENSLPDPLGDPLLTGIAERCSHLKAHADAFLCGGTPSGLCPSENYEAEQDKVRMLVERLRLTGDLLPTEGDIADLLATAVFRNLPQLYEVWVLWGVSEFLCARRLRCHPHWARQVMR